MRSIVRVPLLRYAIKPPTRRTLRACIRSFSTTASNEPTAQSSTPPATQQSTKPTLKKQKDLYRSPMRESIDDSYLPLIDRSLVFEPSSQHTGTIIWLQGLGEDVDALKHLYQMARSDSIKLIVPRANKLAISAFDEKEERAWFDVLTDEMKEDMEEDAAGIEESAALVRQLLDSEAQKLERGSRGIVLGGVAQGGALALHTGLAYDQPLAGIICYSSYLALPERYPEHISKANSSVPLLLIHGKRDQAIPYASFAKPRYDKLKGLSLPIETRVEANMNHQLNASHFVQAMMWSKQMMAKAK